MMIRLRATHCSLSALVLAWLASSWARSGRNPGRTAWPCWCLTGAGIGRFVGGGLGTAVGTQLGSNVMGGLYDAVTGSSQKDRDSRQLTSGFVIRRNWRKSAFRHWPP